MNISRLILSQTVGLKSCALLNRLPQRDGAISFVVYYNYLLQYGKGTKVQFRDLILDKLPDSLNEKQKEQKIGNLLTSLKQKGLIERIGSDKSGYWEIIK